MSLFFYIFFALGITFTAYSTLSKKLKKQQIPIENQDDSRARLWETSLKQLGEKTDFDNLVKEASYNTVPSECITYEAVFTKDEYVSIVRKTRNDTSLDTAMNSYGGWFQFENLEAAIFAKNLSNHIDKMNALIETLQNKETIVGISKKAQETLTRLEEEKETSLKKLKAIIRFEEGTSQPEFSDSALIDEDELIHEIENGVLSEKPTIKRLASNESITTSPALMELNEFLLQNSVPQAISETLTNTMNQITLKLKQELETAKVEALTMEANALNHSAKQFHGIEE